MNRNKTNPHTLESVLTTESLALKFVRLLSGVKVDVEFSVFHCDCNARLLLVDATSLSQSKALILRQARSFAKKNNLTLSLERTVCPGCSASLVERIEHRMKFGAAGLEKNEVKLHRSPVIGAR